MAESDPLTQQYIAMWKMLETHKGFDQLVKVGNRARLFDRDKAPVKAETLTADLPEIRIHPAVTRPHFQRTSNGSSILCGWQVVVVTGSILVDEVLLPLEWEVYRAMANWAATLQILTWRSKQFVKILRAVSIEHGMLRDDLNRGIRGWSAIWSCETESFFTTASLIGD